MENYSLILYFKSEEMTAKEYICFSKNILQNLADVDPIFTSLFGWGKKANARKDIDPNTDDFDKIVFEQIKDNSIVYQNPDSSNKEFTWNSKSFIGYSNSYSNTTRVKDGQVTINIDCGEKNRSGIFKIEFPAYNYTQFHDYIFVKGLFEKCIALIHPNFGCVVSDEFRDKVKREKDKIWIGWFTYIYNKNILNILPNDIYIEEIVNGTIFSLNRSMPDSTDQRIINKALELRNILRNKKLI